MSLPVVIVGLGRMGSLFADIILRNQNIGLDLRGALTRNEEKRLWLCSLGKRCYDSLDEVAEDPEVKGVIVTNPSGLHHATVMKLLNAGKDIFVEKPLALSLRDCLQVLRSLHEKSGKLLVGYMRRLDKGYRDIYDSIDGKVRGYLGISRDPEPPPPGWLRDPAMSGGLIFDLGAHEFDLLIWMAQRGRTLEEFVELLRSLEVRAWGTLGNLRGTLDERDHAHLTVDIRAELEGDFLLANIILSRTSPKGYELKLEVLTEGSVLTMGWCESGGEWFQARFQEAYERELLEFSSYLRGDALPFIKPWEACLSVGIAELVQLSAQEGGFPLRASESELWDELLDLILEIYEMR